MAVVVVFAVAAILTALHGTDPRLTAAEADREFVYLTVCAAARLLVVISIFFTAGFLASARTDRESANRR